MVMVISNGWDCSLLFGYTHIDDAAKPLSIRVLMITQGFKSPRLHYDLKMGKPFIVCFPFFYL